MSNSWTYRLMVITVLYIPFKIINKAGFRAKIIMSPGTFWLETLEVTVHIVRPKHDLLHTLKAIWETDFPAAEQTPLQNKTKVLHAALLKQNPKYTQSLRAEMKPHVTVKQHVWNLIVQLCSQCYSSCCRIKEKSFICPNWTVAFPKLHQLAETAQGNTSDHVKKIQNTGVLFSPILPCSLHKFWCCKIWHYLYCMFLPKTKQKVVIMVLRAQGLSFLMFQLNGLHLGWGTYHIS